MEGIDLLFLLPIIMPLGSTGGCQTTLTSVRRTSGNTSLIGGPGTIEGEKERRKIRFYHYMTPAVITTPIQLIKLWSFSWITAQPQAQTRELK